MRAKRFLGPAMVALVVAIMAGGGLQTGALAPVRGWFAALIWGLIGVAAIHVIAAWRQKRGKK